MASIGQPFLYLIGTLCREHISTCHPSPRLPLTAACVNHVSTKWGWDTLHGIVTQTLASTERWQELEKRNQNSRAVECWWIFHTWMQGDYCAIDNVDTSFHVVQIRQQGGGANSMSYWWGKVGVCRPVLKTLTLFQTKIYDFPNPISDLTLKMYTLFQTLWGAAILAILKKIYSVRDFVTPQTMCVFFAMQCPRQHVTDKMVP